MAGSLFIWYTVGRVAGSACFTGFATDMSCHAAVKALFWMGTAALAENQANPPMPVQQVATAVEFQWNISRGCWKQQG